MIQRAPAVGVLLLAIAAASAPMWWIFGTLQLVVALGVVVLVGAAIGWVGAVRRWSPLLLIIAGLTAIALLAVPLTAPQRIPEGAWLPAFADAMAATVLSWRRLLTIGLPVGIGDSLLMAPVVLVLVATVVGVSIALRSKRAETAALAPALIGVWSILWGPRDLPEPWLSGLIMLVPIAGYVAVVRQARRRSRAPRALSSLARRVGAGVLVAALAVGAASAAGASVELPERMVLRGDSPTSIELQGASPLSAYRAYWSPDDRAATQLTATGLEPGDRIRLAVLNRYDGEVLGVGPMPFERVAAAEPGAGRVIGVTIGELSTQWLPVVGRPSAIRFVGARADVLAADLHRNERLGAFVVGSGLERGDGYQMLSRPSGRVVAPEDVAALEPADPRQGSETLPDAMLTALAAWTGGATTPGARLSAMLSGIRTDGYVSHGVGDEVPSRPGHSLIRLEELFTERMIGDGEQYATVAMLLARQLGFDARVVVGFTPTIETGAPTTVLGADAAAWIEVRTTGGWAGIDVLPDVRPIPEEEQQAPVVVEEPPVLQAPAPAPGGQDDGADPAAPSAPADVDDGAARLLRTLAAIGGVLGLIALIAAIPVGLVLAKLVRRRRRRRADAPRDQAEGAWAEVVDGLRDRGETLSPVGTRLEQSGEDLRMRELAQRVDRAVFAAAPPTPLDVATAWDLGAAVLSDRDRRDGRLRPLLAKLNPASLVQR
ncbi:transglutaminase family protein [Agrococcus sp. Ld7]|uniref:transglutaminase-like domain-containing protein n=1 Tax=Agrococcus sp. Ld7 TaxID=649148 RepID=UPI00386787ED